MDRLLAFTDVPHHLLPARLPSGQHMPAPPRRHGSTCRPEAPRMCAARCLCRRHTPLLRRGQAYTHGTGHDKDAAHGRTLERHRLATESRSHLRMPCPVLSLSRRAIPHHPCTAETRGCALQKVRHRQGTSVRSHGRTLLLP